MKTSIVAVAFVAFLGHALAAHITKKEGSSNDPLMHVKWFAKESMWGIYEACGYKDAVKLENFIYSNNLPDNCNLAYSVWKKVGLCAIGITDHIENILKECVENGEFILLIS